MSQINVSNLTFSYPGSFDNVFENTSFSIDTSWKLGFTGRNGRGKTTFLNLLMGKYEYSGTISTSVEFEYFPFAPENDNVYTIDFLYSTCPNAMDWEIFRELSLLEVNTDVLYRPFNTLSKGESTKIMLAALFLKKNKFLLIDEPTNHLDIEARQCVSRYLKSKSGFILISHDREFLDNCIDHILSINRNGIDIQRGNFSSWCENKERRDNFELSENKKLKKDIKRLSESARKKADWSESIEKTKYGTRNSGLRPDRGFIGHKAAKMMQRSKSIENRQQKAISEKSSLLKNLESSDSLKISQLSHHANTLVQLRNVSVFYGQKCACSNISFSLEKCDRLALKGRNGSGKSSILKLVLGEKIDYTGTFTIGSGLKISYVSQDTAFLDGSLTNYAKEHGIDESIFKAILRKLDFSREQFEKDMRFFSGGQKKKVLIAGSLCEKAHLHIWDEPLNFIDVISRMQIENLILEYQPTMIFVEHDGRFCENIATKTVLLKTSSFSI